MASNSLIVCILENINQTGTNQKPPGTHQNHENNEKAERFSVNFPLPPMLVYSRCLNPLFTYQHPLFCCSLFSKNIFTPRSGSTNTLEDRYFYISASFSGLYLSPEILLNFLWKLCITPWLGKIFRFVVFLPPDRGNLLITLGQHFF